ncbi:MAG: GAF domain-containing protein [Syntrophobacteraceae bacterium]
MVDTVKPQANLTEETPQESLREFQTIFDETFQFIGSIAVDGTLMEANRAALQFIGVGESDVVGKPFWENPWWTHSTELQERVRKAVKKASEGELVRFEATHLSVDGNLHYMDFSLKPLMEEGGKVAFLIAESWDVSERKRTEEALLKANRVINALRECNNALIHAKDETQLLRDICRVIVEVGGYRMAWVGHAEHDPDRRILPVAKYGYEEGYLDHVNVTWKDSERGRGPVGTSIRTGAIGVVRHVEQADFSPWREEAVKRGYASVIGLPLHVAGSVIGSLGIYAAEPDAFDAGEVNLLSGLAANLSFGIETLRTSNARKQAEAALQKAHDELELRVQERTAELERANRELRQIPSKLISVQEEERKRLAFELHDSVGQTLAAVKFWVEMALKLRDDGAGDAVWDHLEQFVPMLQRSIEETRCIYMGLRPLMLDHMGISAAFDWLRRECIKFHPERRIELDNGIAEEEIPEALKISVFRIAQEALNNTLKHSNAARVDISLSKNGDHLELAVSDDGVGMDLDLVRNTCTAKSLGLVSMRERAELTGGSFSIESNPGLGTTVRASWPLDAGC